MLTKKTISIILAAIAIFLFSCNSGDGHQQSAAVVTDSQVSAPAPAPVYDTSLAKGRVADSISSKSGVYALYLPSYYTPAKQFPCIYFFDAHARGSMPLWTYKDIAEKYGFILIGSYTSKNGMQWDANNEAIKALMSDTRAHINIDPKRIYAAGFSGGARVASSVAIMDGGIAGVMGCAAGFPGVDQPFQNKFDYFGMVGDYDFNLTEMEQLDQALAQNGFLHQLLTSGGIHGWASAADFETALLWMQVNGMKEHLQPKNDTLVKALKNDFDKRISTTLSSGEWIKAYELLDGAIRALDGLADIAAYKTRLADLNANAQYKGALAQQQQLQSVELKLQDDLKNQFPQQDEKWWAGKIAGLNKNAKTAKTKQEAQMYRRVLNFLGLVGYMYSDHALKSDDPTHAETFLKIFKMTDPANPDCGYLSAIYYMEKQNPQQAIAALNDAASLGYSDVTQLLTDPAFSSLQADAGFNKVISKVKENNTTK